MVSVLLLRALPTEFLYWCDVMYFMWFCFRPFCCHSSYPLKLSPPQSLSMGPGRKGAQNQKGKSSRGRRFDPSITTGLSHSRMDLVPCQEEGEASSFGTFLPDPTLLTLWAGHLELKRDLTGRSHVLRDNLRVESTAKAPYIQKHFEDWSRLLIREVPNRATEFLDSI